MEKICPKHNLKKVFNPSVKALTIVKLFIFAVFFLYSTMVLSQNTRDTIPNKKDSLIRPAAQNDTTLSDTVTKKKEKKTFVLEDAINYTAYDSISMDLINRKAYLYGDYKEAEINYQNINLKAGYIEIDFNKKELYARGFEDSTGSIINKPVFKEGDKKYESEELHYNFDTKKGLISGVFTEEGQGYLHGKKVKKVEDNTTWIKDGKYTTCENKDPHYQIQFKKAKVIPQDKIVTGPANLIIEDIPTPLWLPFGIFPNKKERANGLIIPSIGESANRGFYLRDGGYYWGIGDHMDLAVRGDIYSRGSWGANISSNYVKRYKYSGSLSLDYSHNKFGDPDAPDFEEEKEFFIRWNHRQSPKARPNSSFNASVNAGSMQHNKFNPQNANDYLSNSFSSSISYSTQLGDNYNFTANFRHNQNTLNKQVDLKLPELSFSIQRFYPFRKKERSGKLKWYENITMSYNMNAKNEISTTDSMLFKSKFSDFRNGVKHSIPLRSNIKVLKHLNFTNSINFNGYWYLNSIRRQWNNGTAIIDGDTVTGYVETDTLSGFTQGYDFSYNSSINTKIYGMYNFPKGPLKAIRHVVNPSVSFNYRPDFGDPSFGYYKHYLDGNSRNPVQYSIFGHGIYGGPPRGKSGQVAFNIQNNLEAKIKDKNDTTNQTRKLILIKSLDINMRYDMAKDSLNWSPLSINAYTTLLDKIDLRFIGTWDPYVTNKEGRTVDKLQWNENGRLFRKEQNQWALDISYRFQSGDFSGESKEQNNNPQKTNRNQASPGNNPMPGQNNNQNSNMNNSPAFDKKWDLGFHYTFKYTNSYQPIQQNFDYKTVQTLGFDANIHVTDKWRVGVNSGWDFESNSLSYTSVNIYRDLHCWEMMFNWIPAGFMKSYNLTIRVKAPALHDLKITKRKSHLDYY